MFLSCGIFPHVSYCVFLCVSCFPCGMCHMCYVPPWIGFLHVFCFSCVPMKSVAVLMLVVIVQLYLAIMLPIKYSGRDTLRRTNYRPFHGFEFYISHNTRVLKISVTWEIRVYFKYNKLQQPVPTIQNDELVAHDALWEDGGSKYWLGYMFKMSDDNTDYVCHYVFRQQPHCVPAFDNEIKDFDKGSFVFSRQDLHQL